MQGAGLCNNKTGLFMLSYSTVSGPGVSIAMIRQRGQQFASFALLICHALDEAN